MSIDSEKQKDEIVALESIYNKEEFSYHKENDQYECILKAHVTLPKDYHFTYKDSRYPEEPVESVPISHLPPLSLFLTLPLNYPSESPPKFTLVSSWLTQPVVAKLCKRLDELWEENEGLEILFTWMAFLRDDTLEFLNITESLAIDYSYTFYKMASEKTENTEDISKSEESDAEICRDSNSEDKEYDKDWKNSTIRQAARKKNLTRKRSKELIKAGKCLDRRAISDCVIGGNLVQMLIDYDSKRKQTEFERNFYTCKICFLDKLGEYSTQFVPCHHVFCKECILAYLEMRIKDGNVKDIRCPENKCLSEATPGQVKDLVSEELFVKYEATLLSVALDSMADVVYCPRPHCQYPATREGNNKMANCPACEYAFCLFCKMVYHGIEPCNIKPADEHKLLTKYLNASHKKRIHLEHRYGKKRFQTMIDGLSEKWTDIYSHKCPHCNAKIEKSEGCNRVKCARCSTQFCWLCATILKVDYPYEHFSDPKSPCYNLAWVRRAAPHGEEALESIVLNPNHDLNDEDEDFLDGFDV